MDGYQRRARIFLGEHVQKWGRGEVPITFCVRRLKETDALWRPDVFGQDPGGFGFPFNADQIVRPLRSQAQLAIRGSHGTPSRRSSAVVLRK